MDEDTQLECLLELAESVGIALRPAPPVGELAGSDHPGGALVRLRGREMLFLDPSACVADRIAVVAEALRGREEIEGAYVPPQVRRLIESA